MTVKVPAPFRKDAPPELDATVGNLDKGNPEEQVPLNFRVPMPMRQRYRMASVLLDIDMKDILEEFFELFAKHRALSPVKL